MVMEASQTGSVDPHVGEIASRAISLTGLTARHVMTPREKIDAIPIDATFDVLRAILLEQGHSRMLVYQGTLDEIAGYVVAKDVFHLVWERDLVIILDLLRPAFFVTEDMLARNVLREFQARKTQMAIVRDAQGRVTGLITPRTSSSTSSASSAARARSDGPSLGALEGEADRRGPHGA